MNEVPCNRALMVITFGIANTISSKLNRNCVPDVTKPSRLLKYIKIAR